MTAPLTKTIVATGASSGLGFELIKSLLLTTQSTPSSSLLPNPATDRYNLILGARDVPRTRAAYDALGYDSARHRLAVLPLELADLGGTRAFAGEVLRLLSGTGSAASASAGEGGDHQGGGVLDYLLLNAAISGGDGAEKRAGFKGWNEAVVVNHFAQHYLMHLLREKLVESKTRVVVVSSGAVRRVTETGESLDKDLKAGSGVDIQMTYSQTKFVQLLGAHWWRRQLKGQCVVVAVSPGLIPGTGLTRGTNMKLTMDMPDAKPLDEGARSILRAFTRDDFPEDPEQIFLTSWGEWWSKDTYAPTLDQALQDKWCPSKDEFEREAGLSG